MIGKLALDVANDRVADGDSHSVEDGCGEELGDLGRDGGAEVEACEELGEDENDVEDEGLVGVEADEAGDFGISYDEEVEDEEDTEGEKGDAAVDLEDGEEGHED